MHEIVSLTEIVRGIEMQSEQTACWLDRDTGQVVTVSKTPLRDAEESPADEKPDPPEWRKREWKMVQEIVSSDRYLQLPTEFDVHEREIMKEFASAIESRGIRDELLHTIDAEGAFRKFQAALRSYGIEKSWFAFRDEALKLLARTWCEQHGIPFK